MSTQADSIQDGRTMWLCAALLVAGCASASLVFACATPFAAFAVLAAAVLPLRLALITIGLVWAVNQAIGFSILDYPRTVNSAMWGLGIGAAALLTTAAAAGVIRQFARMHSYAIYPIALVACYAVYELVMLAMVPMLGGIESFSLEIVSRLAFVNAIWLAGLLVAYELLRRVNGLVPSGAQGRRSL
jgi:hypothetical protein